MRSGPLPNVTVLKLSGLSFTLTERERERELPFHFKLLRSRRNKEKTREIRDAHVGADLPDA